MRTPVSGYSHRRMRRFGNCVRIRRSGPPKISGVVALLIAMASALGLSAPAAAQQVRLTKLTNAAFGTISSFAADSIKAQSVCAYSSTTGGRYNITATGSGSGSAFTLSGGSSTLAYEVQWSNSSGQTLGTSLTPGVALTGQTSGATSSNCSSGVSTTASLIIIIRASTAASATARSYNGTLTLMVAPE